jgi:hypothetical protein
LDLAQTRTAGVSLNKLHLLTQLNLPHLDEAIVYWPKYQDARAPECRVYFSAALDATEDEIVDEALSQSYHKELQAGERVLKQCTAWLREQTKDGASRPRCLLLAVNVVLIDARRVQPPCIWRDVCIDVETRKIVRGGHKLFGIFGGDRFATWRSGLDQIGLRLQEGLDVLLTNDATRYVDLVRARLVLH